MTKLILTTLLAAVVASAQAPAAKPIPRAANGKPDFSGVWQGGGVSLYGEGGSKGTAAIPQQPRTPGPKPEPLVFQDWAEAKVKAMAPEVTTLDPTAQCLLPGLPRIFGMPMPFEIMQTPNKIAILYESFHAWRLIPTTGGQHDDPDPTFMGDSIGHWEGDTLVVDVTGFNGKVWLDGRGHFTTEKLHVVERYTLNGDTISYEATVEDPGVMTKPWKQNMTFIRLKPGERPLEYECAENNQDLEHMKNPTAKATK